MATVREETMRLLKALQMTTIFGNPGSTEMPLFKAFPSDFQYILGLQEASVVGMAEGYAQVTRRAAFVNLHTAPGVGNAMANIIAAFHHKTPLVITAGQQVRPMHLIEPFLYARAATELPRPYVKWSYEVGRPQDVPAAIARAYFTAMQAPQGPVFLSIPMDDWDVEMAPYVLSHEVTFRTAPDPEAIRRVGARLREAKQPAFIVGPDVDREGAWQSVTALAERWQAPVWGSPLSSRSSFPESHPLYRGPLAPAIGVLAQQVKGHDLIVVLGASVFSYYPYVPGDYLPRGTNLIQVTNDPDEAARAPIGTSLVGSVALAIEQLLGESPERSRTARGEQRAAPSPVSPPPGTTCLPVDFVFQTLGRILPPDRIVVEESPSTRPRLQKLLPIDHPGGFYTTGGGGLGYGLPASVGIQLGQPDRRVVCLLGDGSSHYSVQALWSAAHYRIPVLFVVLDNSQYAILKSFGDFTGTGEIPGLDLPGIDIAAIARGYGLHAEKVESAESLEGVLQRALNRSDASLIHIPIERDVPQLLGMSTR